MTKKKIRKWAICGGVLVAGVGLTILIDEPNLAPLFVGIAVARSFAISSE